MQVFKSYELKAGDKVVFEGFGKLDGVHEVFDCDPFPAQEKTRLKVFINGQVHTVWFGIEDSLEVRN